jgi:uncharacterized SAM-binding protein YcdF (DUF218 family)
MTWILFLAKKTIGAFLQPVGLSLALWIVGIILWIRGRGSKAGFVPVLCAGLVLLAASSPLLSAKLIKSLELKAGPYANAAELQKKGVQFIVVLGGDLRSGNLTPSDRVACSSLVRCMEGVRLWKSLPTSKLILSGGSTSSRKMSTAQGMALVAQDLGVPREAIVLETKSLDTAEEAELLNPVLGRSPFALVTSASHMWRSLIIFRRVGLNPVPAPADFEGQVPAIELGTLLPDASSILMSQKAVHEYLGVCLVLLKDLITGRSPADDVTRKP